MDPESYKQTVYTTRRIAEVATQSGHPDIDNAKLIEICSDFLTSFSASLAVLNPGITARDISKALLEEQIAMMASEKRRTTENDRMMGKKK